MKLNKNMANRALYIMQGGADAIDEATNITYNIAGYESGRFVGYLTGYEGTINGKFMREFFHHKSNSLYYIIENDYVTYSDDQFTAKLQVKAQNYLQDLISDNSEIATNILISALFIDELKQKGYDTSVYELRLKGLSSRLKERNKQIIDSGCVDEEQTESVKAFDGTLKSAGIGFVVTMTTGMIILISAVVTAVMASLAWYIFYNLGMEARKDVSDSKELNKLLSTVDAETKQKVFDFVNKYGDSRYKDGIRKVKLENLVGSIKKWGLLAVGAFVVFKALDTGFIGKARKGIKA